MSIIAVVRLPMLLGLGLQAALAHDPSLTVVGADLTLHQLETVVNAGPLDIVVVPANVGVSSWVKALRPNAGLGVAVLMMHATHAACDRLFREGATVCIAADVVPSTLCEAMHSAAAGERVFVGPRRAASVLPEPLKTQLSPKESDVCALLLTGERTGAIAFKLGITPSTVNTHTRAIFRKMGVNSRHELRALHEG